MGIYDRDYYRPEKQTALDWLLPEGSVCKWLFAIYVGTLVVQLLVLNVSDGSVDIARYFALDTEALKLGQVWRLLTYAFLHLPGDFIGFLFGMLFLWWFGPDVENLYGSRGFLTFYLLAIFVGGVAFAGVTIARDSAGIYLWSAGVLSALLTLCAIHFPHRTILLFFILPVPIWALAGFYILYNVYMALAGSATAVALSQLASAAFAGAFYKYRRDHGSLLSDLFTRLTRLRPRRGAPQLKLYRPETEPPREPVAVAAPPAAHPVDEHFEAKLDAVLEKIARSGKESLTADEQQVLIRASELYKKKRS